MMTFVFRVRNIPLYEAMGGFCVACLVKLESYMVGSFLLQFAKAASSSRASCFTGFLRMLGTIRGVVRLSRVTGGVAAGGCGRFLVMRKGFPVPN